MSMTVHQAQSPVCPPELTPQLNGSVVKQTREKKGCGRMEHKNMHWMYIVFIIETYSILGSSSKNERVKMNSVTFQLYHINIKSRRPLSEGKTSRNVSVASFPPGHELCDALRGQRTVTISPFLANPGRPETDVPEAVRGHAAVAYFPGILALLRAMASSTAFNCFSSSSRRERVLLGLAEPEPEAEPEPGPGAGGLPPDAAVGPLPEDLDGGDRGRFLNLKIEHIFFKPVVLFMQWLYEFFVTHHLYI